MALNFDSALGIQPAALALRTRRAELLASNLANADTPGYLARDIPFAQMLAGEQTQRLQMTGASPEHLRPAPTDRDLGVQYRVPEQPAVDGNTVDGDQEMARFAQNSVAFEASFNFLNGRFRTLVSAIRGE